MKRGDPRTGARYRALRRQLADEEHYCCYCSLPFPPGLRFPDPAYRTVEHIQPIATGGAALDRDNCRAAHWLCNRLRTAAFLLIDGQLVAAGPGIPTATAHPAGRPVHYCADPAQCPTRGLGGRCDGHSRPW